MKKLNVLVLSIFILTSVLGNFTYALGQEKPKIAVLDLKAEGVSQVTANAVSEFLRNNFIERGNYDVVERSNMEQIMQEHRFQLSGACSSDECVIELGKMLRAQKVIAGSVINLGNKYYINIRLVDIESARAEKSSSESCSSLELLEQLSKTVAASLSGIKLSPEKIVEEGNQGAIQSQDSGEVIDIKNNGQIVTNLGSNNNVKIGDIFAIYSSKPETEISPITGKTIISHYKIEAIAEFTITYIDRNESLGRITVTEPGTKYSIGSMIKKGRASGGYFDWRNRILSIDCDRDWMRYYKPNQSLIAIGFRLTLLCGSGYLLFGGLTNNDSIMAMMGAGIYGGYILISSTYFYKVQKKKLIKECLQNKNNLIEEGRKKGWTLSMNKVNELKLAYNVYW